MPADYPSQNAGKPTNVGAEKWRKSCLASPQTAGIPTEFNDNGVGSLDMDESACPVDLTGGVMNFRRQQKRNSQ